MFNGSSPVSYEARPAKLPRLYFEIDSLQTLSGSHLAPAAGSTHAEQRVTGTRLVPVTLYRKAFFAYRCSQTEGNTITSPQSWPRRWNPRHRRTVSPCS